MYKRSISLDIYIYIFKDVYIYKDSIFKDIYTYTDSILKDIYR